MAQLIESTKDGENAPYRHFTFKGATLAKADFEHLRNQYFLFAENDPKLLRLTLIAISEISKSEDRYHVLFVSEEDKSVPIFEFMVLNNIPGYDFNKYESH
jgi:hypothetical protein